MEILDLEGHQNCITGSKVTAILLNWWIFSIGGASAVKSLRLQPAQQACFILGCSLGELPLLGRLEIGLRPIELLPFVGL